MSGAECYTFQLLRLEMMDGYDIKEVRRRSEFS